MPIQTREGRRAIIQLDFPSTLKKYVLQEDIEEIERFVFLRRIYHEAPDDVVQRIIRICCQREGMEGHEMTCAFRLACRKLMTMAEEGLRNLYNDCSCDLLEELLPDGLIDRHLLRL